ncbi:MAG: alpha-1,2-fucosyltransferase [Myxococcales bacterium]|nr:alpha-1,2-fucosyltransferase [Myxococcales bacterium]
MYAYARLSRYDTGLVRLVGPGLGNTLFPWARMVVTARRHDLLPIWPTWPQIKVGPLLRGERDARLYIDLFKRPGGYVGGGRKLSALLRGKSIDEDSFLARPVRRERAVVVFEGMRDRFATILQEHRLVRQELLRITRARHLSGVTGGVCGQIAVHVRRGDFPDPAPREPREVGSDCQLPLDWYVHVVRALRQASGRPNAPVAVFSDGSDGDLAGLLALPATRRVSFGASVADLLAMSTAQALVASASSFSAWASYLGRCPTVWFPSRLKQRVFYDHPDAEVECDEGQQLPESFLRTIEWECDTLGAPSVRTKPGSPACPS